MILRPQNTFNLGLRVGWSGIKRFCGRRMRAGVSQIDNEACRCGEVLLLSKVILHTSEKGA